MLATIATESRRRSVEARWDSFESPAVEFHNVCELRSSILSVGNQNDVAARRAVMPDLVADAAWLDIQAIMTQHD